MTPKIKYVGDLLAALAELQVSCAPIKLTIGGTTRPDGTGTVEHHVVYVVDAPPKVVSFVVANVEYVSVTPAGLRCQFTDPRG